MATKKYHKKPAAKAPTPETPESATRRFTGTFDEMALLVDRIRAERGENRFSLDEVVAVFGSNYQHSGLTAIGRLALEALDDAGRSMMVAYNTLDWHGDDADTCNALYNSKCRTEAAIEFLSKLPGIKLERPAVTS